MSKNANSWNSRILLSNVKVYQIRKNPQVCQDENLHTYVPMKKSSIAAATFRANLLIWQTEAGW